MKEKLELILSRVETENQASGIIKTISWAFYFFSGLLIIAGFLVSKAIMVDGIFVGALTFLIQRLRSRLAAIVLALYALANSFAWVFEIIAKGQYLKNIAFLVLSLGTLVLAVRVAGVTFTFQNLRKYKLTSKQAFRKGLCLIIAGLVVPVSIYVVISLILGKDLATVFFLGAEMIYSVCGLAIILFIAGLVLTLTGAVLALVERNKNQS
jgi:hypothetical protein